MQYYIPVFHLQHMSPIERLASQPIRFPNIFPQTRILLDNIRISINDVMDPRLDQYIESAYKKMAEILIKIKKIF